TDVWRSAEQASPRETAGGPSERNTRSSTRPKSRPCDRSCDCCGLAPELNSQPCQAHFHCVQSLAKPARYQKIAPVPSPESLRLPSYPQANSPALRRDESDLFRGRALALPPIEHCSLRPIPAPAALPA